MADYKLGIPGLDEFIPQVRGGSNFLIVGPPMSGKEVLVHNATYAGLMEGEAAIMVSTGLSGEDAWKWFQASGMDLEPVKARVGVVDCVSQTIGLSVGDTERIKRVSSPVNLTGISVAITGFFEEFWMKRGVRKARLSIHSLSTMLMYSNLQTVFRFLHVFTGRIKSADALGFYVIEQGMHDDQTLNTLKQLADGVIEVKIENDQPSMRAATTGKVTPWVPFRVEGGRVKAGAPR